MKPGQYDEKCYNYASVSGGVPTADYLPPNDGGRVAAKFTLKLMGSQTTNALARARARAHSVKVV